MGFLVGIGIVDLRTNKRKLTPVASKSLFLKRGKIYWGDPDGVTFVFCLQKNVSVSAEPHQEKILDVTLLGVTKDFSMFQFRPELPPSGWHPIFFSFFLNERTLTLLGLLSFVCPQVSIAPIPTKDPIRVTSDFFSRERTWGLWSGLELFLKNERPVRVHLNIFPLLLKKWLWPWWGSFGRNWNMREGQKTNVWPPSSLERNISTHPDGVFWSEWEHGPKSFFLRKRVERYGSNLRLFAIRPL